MAIQLKKPQIGVQGWGDSINENFAKIENELNSKSTEISSLQRNLYAMRQLTISGAIKIDEVDFNSDDQTLKLKVRPFKEDGTYDDGYILTDIINVPMNTCYKVIDKFVSDPNITPNNINPKSITWAVGDFLVVGELADGGTTKKFSRLPISIGMYMVPSLGTGDHEGQLVWKAEMAQTSPSDEYTPLPVQYAYGTIKPYKVTNGSITIESRAADPIQPDIQINGTNGLTSFPILNFYQYNEGQDPEQDELQRIEVDYKIKRTEGENNTTYWQVTFDFDDDDDQTIDDLYMYVTMLSNGDLITKVKVTEA